MVIGDDLEEIEKQKKQLGNEFEIKYLGRLKYFLGIEVAHSKEEITISQHKCILDLLKEIRMLGCRPKTPQLSQITNLIEKKKIC